MIAGSAFFVPLSSFAGNSARDTAAQTPWLLGSLYVISFSPIKNRNSKN